VVIGPVKIEPEKKTFFGGCFKFEQTRLSEESENANMTAGSMPLSPGAGLETQAGHVLLMPDVMACVFRADEATEAAVEALLCLQLVCRGWQKSIGLAVRDKLWLCPLRESGQRFCAELPLLVENIISLVHIEQRQERFAHFEAQTRAHMFDADTLVGALQAMDPILDDELIDEASVFVCIDILDTAMQAHPRHAWVHYEVAHAMDYFEQSNSNSDYMTHKGIPKHLVGVLRMHRNNHMMAKKAVSGLNRMMAYSAHTMRAVVQEGAIPLVVGLMRESLGGWADIDAGCIFAQYIAYMHAPLLMLAGVDEIIFRHMTERAGQRCELVRGLRTLTELETAQVPSRIDFCKGLRMQVVVASLSGICENPDRPQWCREDECCTSLLLHLAGRDTASRRAMVAAGVIPGLFRCMGLLRTAGSRRNALEVLVRLAKERRHRRAVAGALVVPAVLAAMIAQDAAAYGAQDASTTLMGCRLFGHLSRPVAKGQKKHPVAPAGAAAAVVGALANFQDCLDIQEAGVNALQTMLMCRQNTLPVSQCGGARVLMAALWRPAMKLKTVLNACVALSCLAETDAPFLQDAAQKHGGIVWRMVKLMDNCRAASLQSQAAVSVLASLVAPYAHMHAVFREAGAAQRVQAVLAKPGLSVKCRAAGERLLRACAL